VASEHVLALPAAPQTQTLQEGISLKLKPSLVDGRVLLQGTFAHTAPVAPSSFHRSSSQVSATAHKTETAFILWATPGEASTVMVTKDKRAELRAEVIAQDNAATVYWQAFAALPPQPEGDDPEAFADWVGECAGALNLLHKAAAMDSCDWELDYSQGFQLLLSHVSKMNSLCKAAVARAKSSPAHTQADLKAAMRAARHIGVDPLIIPQLVRVRIEKQVLEQLAANLASAELDAWHPLLDNADMPSLSALIDKEREVMLGDLRTRLNTASDAEKAEILKAVGLQAIPSKDLDAMLDAADADYRELVRVTGLPAAERSLAIVAFEKKLASDGANPVSCQLLPAIGSLNKKLENAAAERQAMLAQLERLGK
jgi:hypothetical protein